MKQEVIDIEQLAQDQHNFNKGTEQGQELMERSFKEMGAGRSILIDRNGNIIAGNKSQKAAIAAGIKKVRIIETTGDELVAVKRTDVDIDSAEGRKMAYLDNLTTQVNLTWDQTELQAVQADVEGFDIADFGFDIEDLPQVTFPTAGQGEGKTETQEEQAKDDGFDETKDPIERRVALGDIWQLGEHRLMCGDSTDAASVGKLTGGAIVDMAFTSPPYNAGASEELSGNTHTKGSKYANSDDNLVDYKGLLFKSTKNGIDFSKYSFVNLQMLAGNKTDVCEYFAFFKDNLCDIGIWNKTSTAPAMAKRVMNSQFEFIFIFSKDKPSRAVGTREFRGTVSNVFTCQPMRNNEFSYIHAATFSVEFASYYITTFSNKGESILDLFGGTGTSLITCEQVGRKCYMMELDPHYCDVIIARWEKLTGQKAVKLTP